MSKIPYRKKSFFYFWFVIICAIFVIILKVANTATNLRAVLMVLSIFGVFRWWSLKSKEIREWLHDR